jgi:signal transduction histidine kinase
VALPALGMLWRQKTRHEAQQEKEERRREELEAYARLNTIFLPHGEEDRGLAVRVCRVVAQKSAFCCAALLLEDAERQLYVAGSAGFDDVTVAALNRWGVEARRESVRQRRDGERNFAVTLPLPEAGMMTEESAHDCRVLVVPVEIESGRMVGALVVRAEQAQGLESSRAALEVLAVKLGRTIENRQLTVRLLRAEKLGGAGKLAGELARELNGPLAAVTGLAEMIAESARDERVRGDAQGILREAERMQETMARLRELGRQPAEESEDLRVEPLVRVQAAS